MNTLKRSFQIIEELKNEGSLIDSIRLNNSGFSDDEDDCEDDYKCLGNCFEDASHSRVFFARNPYNRYTAYTILETDESTKKVERHLRCFRDFYDRDKMKERLEKYRKPAQFGDVANEETRVDETVRKGFDITLAEHSNIKVSKGLVECLYKAFANSTGMNNVEIVPYKINIYQRGDFFKAHRDSPAKNLIATIVVHIEGEKGVFKVDGSRWEENYTEDNDFCIFFTDVLHEVTPVNKYRETLTFKVFKKESQVEIPENLSKEAQQLAQRIDTSKPFGVLLQNGYTYLDITDEQVPFKGLDEKLVVALRELGVKFKLSPVIVKDELRIKEPGELKWRSREIRSHDEYNGMSDEISNLYIYNLSPTLVELLEMKQAPEIGWRDVYYLGMGYKVGERTQTDLYIGNQYDGTSIENIYLNVMLVSV